MQREKWKDNSEGKSNNNGGVMVSTGVVEAMAASRGSRGTLKSWKINLNANNDYALAA